MKVQPGTVTAHERAVLDAVATLSRQGHDRPGPHHIGALTGQSDQGAAAVAASAVRKGLLSRHHGTGGYVNYRLTPRGRELARPS